MRGAGKEMPITNGWYCLSNEDIVRAFKEVLKYQPKYKLNVIDGAGWNKK